MGAWLTPDTVKGLGVLGVLIGVAILFVVGQIREWFVLGITHRRDLERAANENRDLRAAADKWHDAYTLSAETANRQAETIRNNNATGESALKLLQTFRELTAKEPS